MSQKSRLAGLAAIGLTMACGSDEVPSVADVIAPAAQVQLSGFAAPSGIVNIVFGEVDR